MQDSTPLNVIADLTFLFSMFLLQTAAWSQSGASESSKTEKF
jgi:hypothetical protein